jgi:hypothetical protein
VLTGPKTTITYWNPLSSENQGKWQPIDGLEGMAEALTLSIDEEKGLPLMISCGSTFQQRNKPKKLRIHGQERAICPVTSLNQGIEAACLSASTPSAFGRSGRSLNVQWR